MNSLPAALTWELFARGRWALPAAALGSLALPVLLLSALSHEGALVADDGSTLLLQMIFVQFNALIFGGNIIGLQWDMSRLYGVPASTARLVTWRLLPAMLAMAVETVAWTAAINALFHLDWPLWGPALGSAVVVAVAAAGIWLPGKSRWVIFLLTLSGAALGLWFNSRYGAVFGGPVHLWSTVTPVEILTLAAIAAIAWRLAVIGVARNRRGEPPFSLGFAAWLDRLFERTPGERPAFATRERAQFWYAWRHGWLAPGVVVGSLLIGLVGTLIACLDGEFWASTLLQGVYSCIMLVLIAAIISGAALGNLSARGDLVMGQFLATRPLTCSELARAILRTAAISLLLAWVVWAAALLAAYGLGVAFSDRPLALIPKDQDWRQIPAAVVGSWIIAGVFISVLLTGHSPPVVRLVIAVFFAWIGFVIFAKFALSPPVRDQANRAVAVGVSIACLLGTLWSFIAARRRGLIEPSVAWAALAAWAALVVAAVLVVRPHDVPAAGYAMLGGILALAVLPLAAAPLAIAWNRHR